MASRAEWPLCKLNVAVLETNKTVLNYTTNSNLSIQVFANNDKVEVYQTKPGSSEVYPSPIVEVSHLYCPFYMKIFPVGDSGD